MHMKCASSKVELARLAKNMCLYTWHGVGTTPRARESTASLKRRLKSAAIEFRLKRGARLMFATITRAYT